MNRRDFLKTVGLGSLSLALGTSVRSVPVRASGSNAAGGGGTTNRQPNILVLMSDEHNAGVLGCYGNRIIRTPNLDKLAAAGTTFQNCYTNSPLCVPSRLAFTSGKYISRVGAWNNSCWLPSADYPSLPRILNAAGYESVLCGKMHYDSTRRYGFREIGGNMNNNVKNGRGNRRRPDDLTPTPGLSERFNDFHAGDDSSILNHDRKVTAGTVDFLEHRQAGDKPFFLLAGYLAPHFPLTVPQEYWDH
jgi:choline-sulfatase